MEKSELFYFRNKRREEMGAYEDRTRQFDWLFIGVRGSILGRETREGNTRPEIVVCGRRYVNETTTRCDGSGWIEDVPPYGERERKKRNGKFRFKSRVPSEKLLSLVSRLLQVYFDKVCRFFRSLSLKEPLKDSILTLFSDSSWFPSPEQKSFEREWEFELSSGRNR